jgi:hypothetical protein
VQGLQLSSKQLVTLWYRSLLRAILLLYCCVLPPAVLLRLLLLRSYACGVDAQA